MVEEASLDFRLKQFDKTRNYFLDEMRHKDLMSEKYKKTRKYWNYVENLLILSSTITGCVSISAFASLVYVPVGMAYFALWMKICTIIVGIKRYKSIIKKKKKKHDKIVLLSQDKLNTTQVLISKVLIDSCISHDEFVSINNVLREYKAIKQEIKNPETSAECTIEKWLI